MPASTKKRRTSPKSSATSRRSAPASEKKRKVRKDKLSDEDRKLRGTPDWSKYREKKTGPVGKIEVWGHDAHGYYAGVRIVPWSLSIPHEEVNFTTDSADIRKSEEPKRRSTNLMG